MSTKFQRTKEDFTCEHCGAEVKGTGYTNHCPKCLWSKHVDINPGDRAEECGGMMEPILVEGIVDRYMITQKCKKCGHIRRNAFRDGDNPDVLVEIAKKHAAK